MNLVKRSYSSVIVLCFAVLTTAQSNVVTDLVADVNPNDEGSGDNGGNVVIGDDSETSPTPSFFSNVQKCTCKATEVFNGGQCEEHEALVQTIESSKYNFTVEDIVCDSDRIVVTLPQDSFTTVEYGNIYVYAAELEVPYGHYCIENRFNSNGEIAMEAKVCLSAPTLPKCCPLQQTVSIKENSDGPNSIVCVNNTSSDTDSSFSTIPLYIDNIPMLWNQVDLHRMELQCEKGHTLTSVQVGEGDEAALCYNAYGVELHWMTPLKSIAQYLPGELCLDAKQISFFTKTHLAYFCYQNPLDVHNEICQDKVCVRKCCDEGHVITRRGECRELAKSWMPQIHNSYTMHPIQGNTSSLTTTVHGFPICPKFHELESTDPYILMDDGQLHILSFGKSYAPHRYCLDTVIDENGNTSHFALTCFGDIEENPCAWQVIVQSVALGLSCIFIMSTLFVYLSVPEICKRLASKCVVSESFALLISFMCLITLQAISTEEATVFCIGTGLVFYYSTMASFFWLNIMCVDMYFTIKSIVPVNDSSSSNKWFVRYSLYGWGAPFAFVVGVCVCDNLPYDVDNYSIIRSNIFTSCHIPNNDFAARWLYMYGPLLVLLAINTALFISVAATLVYQRREHARILQGRDSQSRQGGKKSAGGDPGKDKTSAVLCLKLFVVMGVTWITEIISFAEGNVCYVWLVTDIINCLRGLFIFLIFVCKRDVIRKFKNAWRPQLLALRKKVSGAPELKRAQSSPGTSCRDSNSVQSSSFWHSRKTSTASLSFFSFGAKRKTSSMSNNVVDLQKMEALNETDELTKQNDVETSKKHEYVTF